MSFEAWLFWAECGAMLVHATYHILNSLIKKPSDKQALHGIPVAGSNSALLLYTGHQVLKQPKVPCLQHPVALAHTGNETGHPLQSQLQGFCSMASQSDTCSAELCKHPQIPHQSQAAARCLCCAWTEYQQDSQVQTLLQQGRRAVFSTAAQVRASKSSHWCCKDRIFAYLPQSGQASGYPGPSAGHLQAVRRL